MNAGNELLKNLDKLHTKPKSILPMPLSQEMGKIGM